MRDASSHEDVIFSFVSGERRQPLEADSSPLVGESWKRCVTAYRLDPSDRRRPRVLSTAELQDYREPMEAFVRIARHEVDALFGRVASADLVVLLTDAHGITVEYRGPESLAPDLKRAGLYLGSVWSEETEGTNGVGTCIATGEPLTVFQGEHFRTRNIGLTCTVAPVLDPGGRLMAVLDVSSMRPTTRASQALALQIVRDCARRLEKKYLLNRFGSHWVARLSTQPDDTDLLDEYLLVLDASGAIVGADSDAFRRWQRAGALPLLGRNIDEVLDAGIDAICSARTTDGAALSSRFMDGAQPAFIRTRPPVNPRASKRFPGTTARRQSQSRATDTPIWAGHSLLPEERLAQLTRALDRRIPVLVTGETGTGKEVQARLLHRRSRRRDGPFVPVNCAALPESLVESELFGYRSGAFTGADRSGLKGRIREADGGVLFLDEIGDMALALQSRLLRVLANHEVHPLGGGAVVAVDIAVVCATHCDLETLVAQRLFREDLYYRLNGLSVALPPLRARADNTPLILEMLNQEAAAVGQTADIAPQALKLLLAYAWPGNIRQLRHALQVALLTAEGDTVRPEHLPAYVSSGASPAPATSAPMPARDISSGERERMVRALSQRKWCVAQAARDLGISRSTLHRRMRKLGITAPNKLNGLARSY